MNAAEAILSWRDGAKDALDTCETLFVSEKYAHALFFLHLALEKMLKALIIKKTKEPPLPVHDLVRLAQSAGLPLDETLITQLAELSTFNVAARYDEEKLQFHKKATEAYARQWKTIGQRLFQQFQQRL